MGFTSGLVGVGGALAGMFGGGGASSVNLPQQWNMPNMTGAATGAYGGIGNLAPLTNEGYNALPYAESLFNQMYGNQYAAGAQGGAGVASGMGTSAATGAYGAGNALMGAGVSALPYGQQIMNTAFDPQQALYARTAQQTTDQTRAGLEARGMDNTPYGAGVEGQTMANFNIDWQNAQLQRQIQGAGGLNNIFSGAGGAINQGAGIANTAAGQYLTASGMPYATNVGIGQNQQGAINNLIGTGQSGANLANVSIQDYLAYVQGGTNQQNANNATAQLGLNQSQMAFNQNMGYGSALGQGAAALGKGWGNTSTSPFATSMFNWG